MEPVNFAEQTVSVAKDQSEYLPLPAHLAPDGVLTCVWRLTLWERLRVLRTGRIWHQVLTARRPLQPQLLSTRKPDLAQAQRCEM